MDGFMLSLVSLCIAFGSACAAVVSAFVAHRVYRKQTSPDVIVYLDCIDGSPIFDLVIRNIGNVPAWDVSINPQEEIPMLDPSKESLADGALGNGIPFLPPGSSRHIPLGATHSFIEEFSGKVVSVDVVFYDKNANHRRCRYSMSFPIEGDSFCGDRLIQIPLSKEIKASTAALKDINKTLKKIVVEAGGEK